MADYTRKVKDILYEHGCRFVRHGKGGHDVWHSPLNGQNFGVDGKIKKRTSANETLKHAGIRIKI